jgi:deoxyribonuclease V
MIACLDVDYATDTAEAACVRLNDWPDEQPAEEHVATILGVAPYEPGQFYRRELPCLLAVLNKLARLPEVIVVDGYVWLRPGVAGLGGHLHEALGGRAVVIGVAKSSFHSAPSMPVLRGHSRRPLFVTAAGIDAAEAARCIARMHGPYRIPTALKRVDRLCRQRVAPAAPVPGAPGT